MEMFTIDEAEAQFATLISRVEAGGHVVITRDGRPVVTLEAVRPNKRPLFGAMAGMFEVPPDSFFFDPLPEDEIQAWEGGSEDPAR